MLQNLDNYLKLKSGSIGNPDIYLGAKLRNIRLQNGVREWETIPEKYVYESVRNVENYLSEIDDNMWELPYPENNNFGMGYKPDINEYSGMDISLASYYTYHIGITICMV